MKTKLALKAMILSLIVAGGLLTGGCWPAHPPSDYHTIHQYAQGGDANGVAAELAKNPAALNQPEDYGQTPLHLAAQNCHSNVVALLISKGANLNPLGSDNETPLHLAAQEGCADVVKLLVAKGADVNARDKEGRTPLDRARQWKQTNIVSILEQPGAKP